jgi:hypothetical protein
MLVTDKKEINWLGSDSFNTKDVFIVTYKDKKGFRGYSTDYLKVVGFNVIRKQTVYYFANALIAHSFDYASQRSKEIKNGDLLILKTIKMIDIVKVEMSEELNMAERSREADVARDWVGANIQFA